MKTIHKHQLELSKTVKLETHEGALILDIQMQNNIPTIWLLVNDKLPKVTRKLEVYGTGWCIDNWMGLEHIKTVQQPGDIQNYVWHIFERHGGYDDN